VKILILTNNYPNKQALNNGIFIHQQVKALQLLGVECHVLLLHNWYPPLGLHKYHTYWRDGQNMHQNFFEEYEGVKIHPVPMFVKMPTRFFRESYYDRAARSVVKHVRRTKALQGADWLYAHFLTDNGYIAAKVKDQLKVKLAAIARGDDIHAWPEANPALRPHLTFVFEQADALLANSRNLGNDAKKWMLPDNIRHLDVVYNGIDFRQYRPATSAEEKEALRQKFKLSGSIKYMVCVGTPVALKGWMELLEAVKELGSRFDGWQLLIVAPKRPNPDAIDLQKASEELAGHARYIGELPPTELTMLFRVCDAFVSPSYNEGMANALLEAMATGLPCIATEVGGHNEVINNNENGLLIQPRSVSDLVTAISTLTGNDALRDSMGMKARERMLAFGDYVQNAEKLLQLFKKQK
jgi:teichuronic acid biosynthesis glycosyltransferase TuaC